MVSFIAKLAGKDITIRSDGSIIMTQNTDENTQGSDNQTSLNTDYDFGSKKEPQPKGKDASHPSHNQ